MKRKLLAAAAVVLVVLICSVIVGLSVRIVTVRNDRREQSAAVVNALARVTAEVCSSQATSANQLNKLVVYVQAAGAHSTDPETRKFLDHLPIAAVPTCVVP